MEHKKLSKFAKKSKEYRQKRYSPPYKGVTINPNAVDRKTGEAFSHELFKKENVVFLMVEETGYSIAVFTHEKYGNIY